MEKTNYRGDFKCWSDGKDRWDSESVASNFEITLPEPEYVWAQYDTGSYEGSAIVVYKLGGVWYQTYGSHCSCMGLEGQFEPEVLDLDLHFEALSKGKSLIGGYGMDSVELNEWLKWAKN